MKNEPLNEIIIGFILIVLSLALINPFEIWMPGQVVITVLFLTVVVFGVFSVFVWREKATDEREEHLRMLASRFSWMAGSSILLLGLVVQGFAHSIDHWLVYSLIAIILTKIVTRAYIRKKY